MTLNKTLLVKKNMPLSGLRKNIDALDAKIVGLLNERALISKRIGAEKLKNNQQVYAPDREKQVLTRIKSLNPGAVPNEALQAVYREIMSCSLSVEKPLKIAVLGTMGAYTYTAARKIFGAQMNYVSCHKIPEVFSVVEQQECDYGVVPIENSTEGAVTPTFDMLVESDLKICRQSLLEISHNLLSHTKDLRKIKKVYSNSQVFDQCRNWLATNLPWAEDIIVASTTEAAEIASKNSKVAALASKEAAEVFRVPIVRKAVHDIAHNTTRFLVIGQTDAAPTGKDRTSILFSIKDKVGALYGMLAPFSRAKINLTKIESRPSKKKAWDYYFFVDFEGHRTDPRVEKALAQLEDMCKYLKVLGSYPVLE